MDAPEEMLTSPPQPSPSTPTPTKREMERSRSRRRCGCVMRRFLQLLTVVICMAASLVIGVFAFVGGSSIATPGLLRARCKIISSSVDIRSAKVCEVGLLRYEAEHLFYPSERRKFRCRHDYYWASVFEVEYIDYASGRTKFALAEAPDEALPVDCRPTFGVAWSLKNNFKLNRTYDCWYTPGFPKVNIYRDNFFRCQPVDHFHTKMLKRYLILLTRILDSWAGKRTHAKYFSLGTIGGVISGFSASLISLSLIRQVQKVMVSLQKLSTARSTGKG
uniref:Uncharacterized protein n=1 Tax=Kalanchoe fedtschenkoi TaxID=63787 RepID=A0A7N0U0M2_KALFE